MTHCILNVFYFHNINKQVQSALEQNGGQIQFIVASYIFRQYYSMLFAWIVFGRKLVGRLNIETCTKQIFAEWKKL